MRKFMLMVAVFATALFTVGCASTGSSNALSRPKAAALNANSAQPPNACMTNEAADGPMMAPIPKVSRSPPLVSTNSRGST